MFSRYLLVVFLLVSLSFSQTPKYQGVLKITGDEVTIFLVPESSSGKVLTRKFFGSQLGSVSKRMIKEKMRKVVGRKNNFKDMSQLGLDKSAFYQYKRKVLTFANLGLKPNFERNFVSVELRYKNPLVFGSTGKLLSNQLVEVAVLKDGVETKFAVPKGYKVSFRRPKKRSLKKGGLK